MLEIGCLLGDHCSAIEKVLTDGKIGRRIILAEKTKLKILK